ncbi:hypothetical protein JW960_21765 [candidate division KSB1 bacterium]|nr:hypothetical protein [candidate division KSB1 bacterium]
MKSLLIRAENKNKWERRTPLVPADVIWLVENHTIPVFVEHSNKRFFQMLEYEQAGATPVNDMMPGDIILGVKEIPISKILDNKTYLFFSHTIKGQHENMPLLRRIMSGNCTLIDYEKITDENDHRLIFFGRYAGDVGAINILWLMGEHWRCHGIDTAFINCKQAIHYHSLQEAELHMREVGAEISKHGLPASLTPVVIGILGYGNVSTGVQTIMECLPVIRIEPEELPGLASRANIDNQHVYLTVFKEEHLVRRKDGAAFNKDDYFNQPERFESQFEQYLPHLTILVNAIYWDDRYPRFVTWEGLKRVATSGTSKLAGIADITCDVGGSVECNVKVTSSSQPAYRINPLNQHIEDGHCGNGIVVLAVDNLPAEIPNDASTFFSKQLKPFIPAILRADFSKSLEKSGLPAEIKKAVIVYKGELMPDYEYLQDYLS